MRCIGMEKHAGQFSKITGRDACLAKSRVWRSRVGHQWPDDPDIARIVQVMRLHGAQFAAEEGTHQKALCQIIEMLRQRQYVVVMLARLRIQDAAPHA